MENDNMPVTNTELQSQITRLDQKVDERHESNSKVLDDIGKKMDTLIELNVGQRLQAQLIGQLSDKSKEHEKSFDDFYQRLGEVEKTTGTHGTVWKIVGTVLIASLGGVGWLLLQMKDYYHLEYRVDTLEFLVQGRTTPVPPPVQTTSGTK